jgi:hypothetical protein
MKPGQFSFLGDEFENLFHYSDLFLPGIEKITGIYFSPGGQSIKLISRKRDEPIEREHDSFISGRETLVMIQKYRSEAGNYSWIKKDELPFELPARKLSVPNIFTELENVILVLKFPNEFDGLHDLLFIYFNQNLGNFALSRSEKYLSAENKSIIGYLLFHQFRSILWMNHENLKLLRTFNKGVISIVRSNNSLKDQLRQVQMNYSESMVNLSKQYLSEYSSKQSRTYAFTQDAIEKIRTYQGNIRNLPVILENSIIFTENLTMVSEDEVTLIQDFSLDFDSYQVSDEGERTTRKIDGLQSKAIFLLDKLEKSAASLKSRSMPLTSSNVGKNMVPGITAPAITDALAKNKEMIQKLVAKYPEKWENIRRGFRPLLNVLRTVLPGEAGEVSA